MSLTTLCQSCGMCCDGTLFGWVPVTEEEARTLRGCSLPVLDRVEDPPIMPQPCAALSGTRCTIYAQRPARCRQYVCNLYSALEAGEVDAAEALAVVDGARELLAEVALAFGLSPAAPEVLPTARRRAEQQPPPSDEALEVLEKAERYLRRHFRGRR